MTKTQAVGPQAPVQLRCEYVRNPLGIDRPKPRLSWVLEHSAPNQYQRAYQIIVADDKALIAKEEGNIWDSGKVECSRSTGIVYAGKELESCRRYYWRVRWWDKDDQVSPYSCINVFETGFLKDEEWTASWIAIGDDASADAMTVDNPSITSGPGVSLGKSFPWKRKLHAPGHISPASATMNFGSTARRSGTGYWSRVKQITARPYCIRCMISPAASSREQMSLELC